LLAKKQCTAEQTARLDRLEKDRGVGAAAGANAVIASRWPVADSSTSVLMQQFYRVRENSPGMTKLEALREAQLELLRKHYSPGHRTDAGYSCEVHA
jgi:hypothetical protein